MSKTLANKFKLGSEKAGMLSPARQGAALAIWSFPSLTVPAQAATKMRKPASRSEMVDMTFRRSLVLLGQPAEPEVRL